MPCVAGAAVPCRPSHGLPLLVQVLAAVTALSTEAIAKGVLNVPEEDEDESQREAMDWTAVAQGTGLNFARESTALTLQRAAEKISKPRVRHPCPAQQRGRETSPARKKAASSSEGPSSRGPCRKGL